MAKKIPIRQCVVCRQHLPKPQLARIVRTPEGQVVYDPRGKAPGRGAYICRTAQCLEKARKNRGLARALETEIGDDVYDALGRQMEEDGDG